MYIGPWQEYRLAKIQDDAIQRLRKEWEDQLREHIPQGDDDTRIRELMQPMLAKLPSLLLASKNKSANASQRFRADTASASSLRNEKADASTSRVSTSDSERPSSSQSAASSVATISTSSISRSQRRVRDESKVVKQGNQETHDEHDDTNASGNAASSAKKPLRPPGLLKKKKCAAPLTALEEVQRRKKMFSKWIKQSAAPADANTPLPTDPETSASSSTTRLPPIRPVVHEGPDTPAFIFAQPAAPSSDDLAASAYIHLPPIHSDLPVSASEWDFLQPYESIAAATEINEPNLEDSLDEDEVNNLLNWTDTLLSPNALDEFPQLDDDLDIG
uniref:Uncharacterized protein n=1 Tax=Globisporangium ultimum (strain ATCC 200006 / CBS 805.95 / DAOM BR144) TaxID=431595 RepID=K3WLC6_GLOUD